VSPARKQANAAAFYFFLTAALTTSACSPVPAHSADHPFGDKTVRIVVAFAAGGGYDLHARVFAEHLGRHLPGTPSILVENMAGAGGLVAGNFLARQAAADGLTIGMLGPGSVPSQLMTQPGVQYDLSQFAAIGAPTSEPNDVCIATRASGIDLAAWRARPGGLRIATLGRGSALHLRAAFLASALHLPSRLVSGYRGSSDARVALDGGEVDVMCLGLTSYRTTIEPMGTYVAILQSGEDSDLLRQRVPSADRLVEDDRGRALLNLLGAIRTLDRFYVAPPGTPESVLAMLRRGFEETMRDERFAAAARAARLEIKPLTADELRTRIASILNLSDTSRQSVINVLSAEELR